MLKKRDLTHPKAAKLATLGTGGTGDTGDTGDTGGTGGTGDTGDTVVLYCLTNSSITLDSTLVLILITSLILTILLSIVISNPCAQSLSLSKSPSPLTFSLNQVTCPSNHLTLISHF